MDYDDTSPIALRRGVNGTTATVLGGLSHQSHQMGGRSRQRGKGHDYYETETPSPDKNPRASHKLNILLKRPICLLMPSRPLPERAISPAMPAPNRSSVSSTLSSWQPFQSCPLLGPVVPKVSPHEQRGTCSSRLLPSPSLDTSPAGPVPMERRHAALPVVPCPHRCQGGGVLLISAPRSSRVIQS